MPGAVAITGLGAVSALGVGVAALRAGVAEGRPGIRPVAAFGPGGPDGWAAEVPELPAVDALVPGFDAATRRRLSHPDRLAVFAATEALGHAGLDADARQGAVLVVGATTGGMRETEAAYGRRRSGADRRWRLSRVLGTPQAVAAAVVSQACGVFGPRWTVSTACSSGALAIGLAADAIRRGEAAVALAIGADTLCRLTWSGFDALRALDPRPCRPFDRDRAGLTLGEGAGALVLEDAAHARARGARVVGWLRGWAATADAYHATAPHPEGTGAEAALREALDAAGLPPEAIDYVNAHGSGTPHNDGVEVGVLRRVLGGRLVRVPVSSTKSQIGHCLGAAGTLEAVVTLLALETGILPPTLGLETPEWPDLDFVREPGRRAVLGVAASSSYGFGGHNVTLVLAGAEAA